MSVWLIVACVMVSRRGAGPPRPLAAERLASAADASIGSADRRQGWQGVSHPPSAVDRLASDAASALGGLDCGYGDLSALQPSEHGHSFDFERRASSSFDARAGSSLAALWLASVGTWRPLVGLSVAAFCPRVTYEVCGCWGLWGGVLLVVVAMVS